MHSSTLLLFLRGHFSFMWITNSLTITWTSKITCSHNSEYAKYCLVCCDSMHFCRKWLTFWRNTPPPYTEKKEFQLHLHLQGASASKTEAIHSSKMLLTTYKTIWHHNPQDTTNSYFNNFIFLFSKSLWLWIHYTNIPLPVFH